jgi:hypothetical protein
MSPYWPGHTLYALIRVLISIKSSILSNEINIKGDYKNMLINKLKILIVCLLVISFPLALRAETLDLPTRPPGAMEGSAFKTYIENMSLTNRENAIIQEVTTGNIPDFMRNLVPVTVSTTIGSQSHTAIYHVIPDYLAVGSDTDYFLMPMTPLTAQKIADALGCNLPTRKMVNDIWSQATVKLSPAPIPPSPEMTTVPVFWDHNIMVRAQRAAYLASNPLGHLVGGDKKDVVVTKLLATNPGRVAIYGWHYTSGTPIQNLYLGHVDYYADYSHGIRLVKLTMTLDGNTTTVPGILQDATYNVLLSDEGVVATYRYPVLSRLDFPYEDSSPSTGRQLSSWIGIFLRDNGYGAFEYGIRLRNRSHLYARRNRDG